MPRSLQKSRIKAIIETLAVNGGALTVFTGYTRTHSQFPYAFLSSGSLTPNQSGGSMLDNGTYQTVREYTLHVVFASDDSETEIQALEASIDTVEGLVVNKIRSNEVRNDGLQWVDVTLAQVSSPFNGLDIGLDENRIVKSFTILCESLDEYQTI